jgi:hypothetical protein
MSKKRTDSLNESSVISTSAKTRYQQNLAQAEQLLSAYQQGAPKAIAQFEEHHPQAKQPGFTPTLQDARLLISASGVRIKKLSLEKLKKEAKDLLKALKENQLETTARLHQHHPKGPQLDSTTVKLADAQCVIAHENGLASWAKLKHHFALMQQAQEHLQRPHLTLDHDLKTLHLRCGTDIEQALPAAGFSGDFMEISNPFPQGQVPPFDPVENFVKIRSDFITQSYAADVPPEYADRVTHAADEINHVEQRLRTLPDEYKRIVLWFEHDPFDQLCFAYLLAHLANVNLGNCKLELVQTDRFPGIKKFIGIGYLGQHPECLITLWQQRTPVTSAMIAFGARCWHAFTADTPLELWQLSKGLSPLPLMQQAMLRMLKELPWTTNGLGLTEQLALEIINRDGPINTARAFHFLNTESEPMSFLGDIMFLSALRPLWQHKVAALKVTSLDVNKAPMLRHTVEITDTGRALLAGQLNWLEICDPEYQRWVGGVRITQGRGNWYWNPENDKLKFVV